MKLLRSLVIAVALVVSSIAVLPSHNTNAYSSYDVVLYFPLDRYPETGDHIRDAIAAGQPDVCTIERDGADERREECSLSANKRV